MATDNIEMLPSGGLEPSDDDVALASAEVKGMQRHWQLPDTLLGGTLAMRDAGDTYTPRFPAESYAAHSSRVESSFLFNAYRDTLKHISAKPFSRPAVLLEDTPERIVELSENMDLSGSNLSQFLASALKWGIHHGIVHAYTDAPTTPAGLTLAEERELGLRPYAVLVPATNVIGWRSEVYAGERVLTQVRIREDVMVPSGKFGEQQSNRVRVFNFNTNTGVVSWDLYVYGARERQEWARVDGGVLSFPRIPFRTFSVNPQGYMTALPGLEDLAWLNLEHWQSSSDQRNILHTARVPILFANKVNLDGADGLGSGTAFESDEDNASMRWVEHSGNAIEAGRTDLLDIIDQMVALGLKPLIEKPGDSTATENAINSSESNASLRTWVRRLERFGDEILDDMAEWQGGEKGAQVSVHSDFGVTLRDAADIQALTQAYQQDPPAISRQTYWAELKRRGVLADTFDENKEPARIRQEHARRKKQAEKDAPKPQPAADVEEPVEHGMLSTD